MAISEELGERGGAGLLEYRERGDGPAMVFAHGAAGNGDLWRKGAPQLADRYRCIVPDLPLGAHSLPLPESVDDCSLFGQANLLADFIEALDLHDVTLVGNDTGGAISQAVVTSRPERIGRLVLTSCDAFDNYPPKAVAWLKPTCRVPPGLWLLAHAVRLRPVQRLPVTYGWATNEAIEPRIMDSYTGRLRRSAGVRHDFARLLTQARKSDMRKASEGVSGFDRPARVIWAAGDRFFPRAHGQLLAKLLPQGRFELVERSRTFIPEDNPGALVRLLREGS